MFSPLKYRTRASVFFLPRKLNRNALDVGTPPFLKIKKRSRSLVNGTEQTRRSLAVNFGPVTKNFNGGNFASMLSTFRAPTTPILKDELVTIPSSGSLSMNFGLLSLMSQFSFPGSRSNYTGLEQPGDKQLPRLIYTLH
jgi:hypothetical protein